MKINLDRNKKGSHWLPFLLLWLSAVSVISLLYPEDLQASEAPSLLNLSTKETLEEINIDSFVELSLSKERFINQSDKRAERFGDNFFLQHCETISGTINGCLLYGNHNQKRDLLLVQESYSAQFSEAVNAEYVGFQIASAIHETTDVAASIHMRSQQNYRALLQARNQFGALWLAQGQEPYTAEGKIDFALNDLNRELSLKAASPLLEREMGGRLYTSNYTIEGMTKRAMSSRKNTQIQSSLLQWHPKRNGWYGKLSESERHYLGVLETVDQPLDELDRWEYQSRFNNLQFGYKTNASWIGFLQQTYHYRANTKLTCEGKDWGLSGNEQLIICLFSIPYVQANASVDVEVTGLQAGRQFEFLSGNLKWDNLIGLAHSKDDHYLKGSEVETENHQQEDWIWSANIHWSKEWRQFTFTYAFQQLIPLEGLLEGIDRYKTGNGKTGQSGNSRSSSDIQKDWQWPLPGGFHFVSLKYDW